MPKDPMPEQNAARYKSGTFLTSSTTVEAICEDDMVGFWSSVLSDVNVLGRMMTEDYC
jgi:hypothetical protein